ncbi:SRPBCC domain-containing protein [Myxococcus stipitatus]|uniref:SRPBCC domain-containing protein n=1 Tax=Myxococcus stipitatus TaxID=83455 RepID=UPI001F25805E|nr:SRPBCC domain-containing protein [Myxococcus stipitatus]MCE9673318.1 SRPBCC domain-containing protein [Myxococcus stipitatus]
MSKSSNKAVVTLPTEREIRVERVFEAPRERVWRAMTDPKQVARWWGRGHLLVVERLEVERGGHWRFVEHAEDGVHGFEGRFREVSPPERMVQTFEWDGMPGHVIVNTTTLEDLGDGRTRVVTTSLFHTTEERDGMAASDMAEGLEQSQRALDALLAQEPDAGAAPQTPEQEVRAEFEQWFVDTARRDLDALMSKIADDAVSYEHDAPLQHVGIAAIREVCRRGFELSPGEIHWEVPDLEVLVRGDLAVTWGLNRMYGQGPDGARFESWSRGTRVFQKRDGRWKMIHEHVSFPYDPETGQARTDLRP